MKHTEFDQLNYSNYKTCQPTDAFFYLLKMAAFFGCNGVASGALLAKQKILIAIDNIVIYRFKVHK